MIIQDVCSVAFYCQRCGNIHVRDIPYFLGTKQMVLRCANCRHEQAVLLRRDAHHLDIRLSCVVCGKQNEFRYSLQRLRRIGLEKVYCANDHFELGYIGRRKRIEELLTFNQAEFEALHPSDGKNFIEKQQILLEAWNRVHEMAADGDILCPCGSNAVTAFIEGNSILLECVHCGRFAVLRAENAEDLARLEFGTDVCFAAPHFQKNR